MQTLTDIPVDIIIYGLIAVGLILWLRSLLGMRQEDERQRPNPFSDNGTKPELNKTPSASNKTGPNKIGPNKIGLALPGKRAAPLPAPAVLARHMTIADSARPGLDEIANADKYFNTEEFLKGAQDAFVMVVEGFAAGDRVALEPLLEPDLFAAFDSAIKARDAAGQKATVEIHAVRHVALLEAGLDKKTAFITIRFVADETNIVHGPDDTVVSGNPDRISEAADIWTFRRDLKSKGPEWTLARTQEDATAADDGAVVPSA